MSLAVKPTTRSPLTVPACLPSRLTCQTHGECCASVMPLLRGRCIMANSIRWSLIEGHGPPRVGSGKWKSRRRQGLGGRGNSEATPEAPPLSSKFGHSLGGSTRVLSRGATPAGPDPPSPADDTGPRCSALQQWRTAHHRPWPSATPRIRSSESVQDRAQRGRHDGTRAIRRSGHTAHLQTAHPRLRCPSRTNFRWPFGSKRFWIPLTEKGGSLALPRVFPLFWWGTGTCRRFARD